MFHSELKTCSVHIAMAYKKCNSDAQNISNKSYDFIETPNCFKEHFVSKFFVPERNSAVNVNWAPLLYQVPFKLFLKAETIFVAYISETKSPKVWKGLHSRLGHKLIHMNKTCSQRNQNNSIKSRHWQSFCHCFKNYFEHILKLLFIYVKSSSTAVFESHRESKNNFHPAICFLFQIIPMTQCVWSPKCVVRSAKAFVYINTKYLYTFFTLKTNTT